MAPPNPAVINRRLPPALLAVQRERLPQPALYSRSHITNFVLVAVFYAALAVVTFLLVNPITPAPPVLPISYLQGILDLLPVVPTGEERALLLPYAVASENIYASLGTTIYLSALGFVTLVLAFTSLRIADRAVDMMDADGDDLPISILFTRDGILFFALVIQVELFGNSPQKAERALQDMLQAYRASLPQKEDSQQQQQNIPQTPKTPALPTPPVSSAEKSTSSKKKQKGAAKKKKQPALQQPRQQPHQQQHFPEEQLVFVKGGRNSIDNSDLTPSQGRRSFDSILAPVPEPSKEEALEKEKEVEGEYVIIEEPNDEASAEDNEESALDYNAPSEDFDDHSSNLNEQVNDDITEEEELEDHHNSEIDGEADSENDIEVEEEHTAEEDEDEEDEEESSEEESMEESEEPQQSEEHETISEDQLEQENQRSYTSIWEFGKHIDLLRGIYPTATSSSSASATTPAKAAVPPGFEEGDRLEELPFTERTRSRFAGYFTSKSKQEQLQQQQEKQNLSASSSNVNFGGVSRVVPNMVAPSNPPRATAVHMETAPPTAGAAWRWKINSPSAQYARPYATSIASPHNYPQAYSQDMSTWRNSAYHRRVSSAATTMSPPPTATSGYVPPGYYNQAFSSLNVPNRTGSNTGVNPRNNSTSSSFFASNASMMSNPENLNPYAPPKRNYSRNSSSSSSSTSYGAGQSYYPQQQQQQQQHSKEKRYYN